MIQEESKIFDATFSDTSKAYLLETTRWTKFLSICGFIFIGLLLLIMVGMLASSSMLAAMGPGFAAAGVFGVAFLFLIMIALYWYPVQMMYQFSTSIKLGLTTHNEALLNKGFRCQKNMYKYMGILTIVMFAFYLLMGIMTLGSAL